ncbi:Ubiquitin_carboxyl-terminal hydrolase family protein [Hexamita inflata]|uniref:Ubiquitin carboxyl-terminal hydrolase n=1 Tax=Hexamita inflata TaxID=28002 RepID=A0AA86RSJ5_9EUKA|nr:Ubiquitin carboxyl-terminal hydrolase family protein [Hexamita inflata]
MTSLPIPLARSCAHLQQYENKATLTEKCVVDLLYSNIDKITDLNLCCNEPNCVYKRDKLWFCLSCGYIGCGENENKHVNAHFLATSHHHFVNIENKQVWCYSCYDFVHVEKTAAFFIENMKTSRKYDKWVKERQQNIDEKPNPVIPISKTQNLQMQAELYLQSQQQIFRTQRFGELGVVNNAATCYMDSVLQALAHTQYFGKWFWTCGNYLQSLKASDHLEQQFTIFTSQAFQALQIFNSNNEASTYQEGLNIQSLYRALQAHNPMYLNNKQQDAQEFLLHLFEILQKVLNQFSKYTIQPLSFSCPAREYKDPMSIFPQKLFFQHRDIISDCFKGIMINTRESECKNCRSKNSSQPREDFICQNLELQGQGDISLEECLKNTLKLQIAEKSCDQCHQQAQFKSATDYLYLPPILCLSFKCYNADQKLSQQVRLPDILDLTQFLSMESPHRRFLEYANTPVQPERSANTIIEKIIPQAVSFLVAKHIMDAFAKRHNVTDLSKSDYSVITECLAMCSLTNSFYELYEQTLKEFKAKSSKVVDQGQKVYQILRQVYQEFQLIKQGKPTQFFATLRSKLFAKLSKDYKIAYDIDAMLCGEPKFKLTSVVQHSGGLGSGHYTAAINMEDNQTWKIFDANKLQDVGKNFQSPSPYLVFYQKQMNPLQEAIIQVVYTEIYSEVSRGVQTKMADTVFEFYRCAQDFIKRQLQSSYKIYPEKCTISGDFIYRLQTMPWPGGHQFQKFSDAAGKYAVQPAMVPPAVQVSGKLFAIIEAVFGQSSVCDETLIETDIDSELELFDQIFSNEQEKSFVLSMKFVQKWQNYLFNKDQRFFGIVNSDLCSEKRIFNRFELKKGLKKEIDFCFINKENWTKLGQFYKVFEVEVFEEDDIEGIGVEQGQDFEEDVESIAQVETDDE